MILRHSNHVYTRPGRRFIALLLAAGAVLSACGTLPEPADAATAVPEAAVPAEADPQTVPQAEKRPDPADREDLTVAFSAGPLELDPRKSYSADEAQLFTALYEGLFSYNPLSLQPVPAAAARWTLSEDKRVWTFTLREGLRYWNGAALKAEHFRDAWLSLIDPGRESPYSSLFDLISGARDYRLGRNADPESVGIAAPDDKTLIIKLTEPAAFFSSMLCHHSFSPVHPDMLAVEDWSAGALISNGPYYILERRPDRLILARNELYWDSKRVAFKRLTIRFAQDGAEAASLWDSGEARWVAGEIDLDALRDTGGISVNAMFATHYYFIRSAAAPWNDKRVRRALSLALPWEEIRKDHYLPATTLIFPIPGYPKIEGVGPTDVAGAQALLAEAGYPEGVGMPETVLRITPAPEAARIAGLMAQAWKEQLRIPVRIEVVPYDDYFDSLKKDGYTVGSTTWIGDFADPYTFLQMWLRDSNLNDAGYDDGAYEALIEKSMAQEGEERWQTLSEAEKLLLDEGTVLPISYTPAVNIIDLNELDGWYPNPLDIHPFKYLIYAAFRPLPGVASARQSSD